MDVMKHKDTGEIKYFLTSYRVPKTKVKEVTPEDFGVTVKVEEEKREKSC